MTDFDDPDARQRDERRFIRVTGINVRDSKRSSKFKIVLQHGSKASEVFKSESKGNDVTIPCETYVEIIPKVVTDTSNTIEKRDIGTSSTQDLSYDLETALRVERHDNLKLHLASQRSSFVPLHLSSTSGGEIAIKVHVPKEMGLSVDLQLGDRVTLAEVAEGRLQKAVATLRSKENMMGKLEYGTNCLQLFMTIGSTAAELNLISQNVAKIVQAVFQQIQGLPKVFMDLRDVILSLVEELASATSGIFVKAFETQPAREALDKMIELIVDAAMEISRRYGHSKPGTFVRELLTFGDDRAKQLRDALEKHKVNIHRVFVAEIKVGVMDIGDKLELMDARDARLEAHNLSKEEEELLNKLLPPKESIFGGKPPCLKGTRVAIIDKIVGWTRESDTLSRLFWLFGVAGCGKSSVAESIALQLDADERLAGSFFCKRDQDERRNPIRLIWTLAFYLAKHHTTFRSALLVILREPDTFVNENLDKQFQLVLEKPLSKTNSLDDLTSGSMLFVIDALDECEQTKEVIELLAKFVKLAPWVRVILTSRFHPDIHEKLEAMKLSHVECNLFSTTYDARDDIRAFLTYQFEAGDLKNAISGSEKQLVSSYVDQLAEKSQGLFIWINSIVKYINRSRYGKLGRLKEILAGDTYTTQEAALDSIYKLVVKSAAGSEPEADTTLVRLILGHIVAAVQTEPLTQDTLYAMIQPSTQVSPGEFEEVLGYLSSILITADGRVRAFHASVLDFMSSEERCGKELYIPSPNVHSLMASRCFEIMEHGTQERLHEPMPLSGLKFNILNLKTTFYPGGKLKDPGSSRDSISSELCYSAIHCFSHLFHAPLQGAAIPESDQSLLKLSETAGHFLTSEQSLFWFELLSVLDDLPRAANILDKIQCQTTGLLSDDAKGTALELRFHLDKCYTAIDMNVSHLYVSSMSWIQEGSRLWNSWHERFTASWALEQPLRHSSALLRLFTCPEVICALSVSPNCITLAIASLDGMLRILDIQTGRIDKDTPVLDITRKDQGEDSYMSEGQISTLSYSADGKTLVFGALFSPDIYVCDAETLNQVNAPLTGHTGDVTCISVSQHGMFASGSDDKTIRIWNATSFEVLHVLEGHNGAIMSIDFSPDGTHLASGSRDGEVRVWSTSSLSSRVLNATESPVTVVAFSHDSQKLASGTEVGMISVWDIGSSQPVGHPMTGEYVSKLSWTPDDAHLLSVSSHRPVMAWNLDSCKPLKALLSQKFEITSLTFTSDNGRLIVPDGNEVYIYDVHSLLLQLQKDAAVGPDITEALITARFQKDGSRLQTGYDGGSIRIWDANTTEIISEQHVDQNWKFLAFSSTGSVFATSQAEKVSIWDEAGSLLQGPIEGDRLYLRCASFSPDGSLLACTGSDFSFRILDVVTGLPKGDPISGNNGHILCITFSPDGRLLATGTDNHEVLLWDVDERTVCREEALKLDSRVECLAFSPDGEWLASGDANGSLTFWNVEKWTGGHSVSAQNSAFSSINAIVFSHDGHFLYSASGNDDCTVQCWDVKTGTQLGLTLRGHSKWIRSISLSPDGNRLVTTSGDSTARIWDCQSFFWERDETLCQTGLVGPNRIPAQIDGDGWLRTRTPENGLLFWVPEEHRVAVCDMSEVRIPDMQENRPISIKWDELSYGERWTDVYTRATK